MSPKKYVPNEEDMREAWRAFTGPNRDHGFGTWLARVRRDAAREALDGLADESNHVDWEMDGPSFALRVRRFKNRKYPEETP